jgi:hypothetical protein
MVANADIDSLSIIQTPVNYSWRSNDSILPVLPFSTSQLAKASTPTLKYIHRMLTCHGTFCIDGISLTDYLLASNFDAAHLQQERDMTATQMSELLQLVFDRMKGRKLFITDKGYPGLGPRRLEKGDIICTVLGSSIPVVLRKIPTGAGYNLIGQAYLYGVAEDIAMAALNPVRGDRLKGPETFDIY